MKQFCLIVLLMASFSLVALSNDLLAQPQEGSVGITAVIQNVQLDFGIPIWIADEVVLVPAFGFLHASDRASDWAFGLAARSYIKKEKLSPYLGARFGAFILSPKDGDSLTDYLAGVFFGGEYFFDKHFSVGGELQLNATISDEFSGRFGNPDGTNFNTASVVSFSFYFK